MMARLRRLNRDRRAVALTAECVLGAYLMLPPVLWCWSARAERLRRRADKLCPASAMVRGGAFRLWGWSAPRTMVGLITGREVRNAG